MYTQLHICSPRQHNRRGFQFHGRSSSSDREWGRPRPYETSGRCISPELKHKMKLISTGAFTRDLF